MINGFQTCPINENHQLLNRATFHQNLMSVTSQVNLPAKQ